MPSDDRYTLETYVAEQDAARPAESVAEPFIAAGCVLAFLGIMVGTYCLGHDDWLKFFPKKEETLTLVPGTPPFNMVDDIKNKPTPITSGPMYIALSEAITAWEGEVGDLPFDRPALEFGLCDRDPGTIACAHPKTNRITIVSLGGADAKTVLMHEIGHLLNVPHIQLDDLMTVGYHEKLDKPTPLAVALAKFQMKNHVKTGMEGE